MSEYRILVIVGSLRKDSMNAALADAVVRLAPADFRFHRAELADLPLYNEDEAAKLPSAVRRLRADIQAAQGILFVTPEYNRSIPALLKNAIDYVSWPPEESVWTGKPAGILGISPGPVGTAAAQQHLRNILASLDVVVLGKPEAFVQAADDLLDARGNIAEGRREFFQAWMDKYVAWIERHATW